MKIAILLSTYNGEKYLNELLKSIKDQDIDAEVTIFIRDDGSKDSTLNIIEKWTHRIDIVLLKGTNKGPRDSFYDLIKFVPKEFDYYAFCDQDDIWHKDKLSSAVRLLEKNNNNLPLLYFCNVSFVDSNGKPYGMNRDNELPLLNIENVVVKNPALGCTMVFNEKLIKQMLKVSFKYYFMHDVVAIDLAAVLGKIIYDEVPRVDYRQHLESVTQGHNIIKRVKDKFNFWFFQKDISIANQANEILNIFSITEDRESLLLMKNYKKSFNRFKLVSNKKFRSDDFKCNRSFILRVILGVA